MKWKYDYGYSSYAVLHNYEAMKCKCQSPSVFSCSIWFVNDTWKYVKSNLEQPTLAL